MAQHPALFFLGVSGAAGAEGVFTGAVGFTEGTDAGGGATGVRGAAESFQ